MTGTSSLLRRIGLVLAALFSVGGILFGLGYAFADLPLATALLITAAIVVPLVGLTVLAWHRRELAPKVLTVAVGLFAAYATLAMFVDVVEGPDVALIALVLALPVAVMGQRHALWSGALLLVLSAAPLLEVTARMVGEPTDGRPGMGDLLGGSTGAVVVPTAVLGVIFLVAGALRRDTTASRGVPVPPPAREPQHH